MSALDRAADFQRELAVLVVRHDEVRRRLESLVATVREQDARLVRLRARIAEQRAHFGDEVERPAPADPAPGRPSDPAPRPEQEGDIVAGTGRRPSHIRQLRPDGSVLGPVSAGLLALLGNAAEASDR